MMATGGTRARARSYRLMAPMSAPILVAAFGLFT